MHQHLVPHGTGWLEVVVGCMFSGKTEELIRRVRRAQYGNLSVVVFKPTKPLMLEGMRIEPPVSEPRPP